MSMPILVNHSTSSPFTTPTQSSSPKKSSSTSTWGKIVSIPSKVSTFFNKLWQQHGPTLKPMAERVVKAVGVGAVVGLLIGIVTGNALSLLGMGAAVGLGYLIGVEVYQRKA